MLGLVDATVGKTSVLRRLATGMFSENHIATIGVEFFNVGLEVEVEESVQKVQIQLWDTAGQERFRTVAPAYYRGGSGVVVVYNVCSASSFESVESWVEEAKTHARREGITLSLVGNKADLAESGVGLREVDTADARRVADAHGMLFAEVSAKTGAGVREAYAELAASILADPTARKRAQVRSVAPRGLGSIGGGVRVQVQAQAQAQAQARSKTTL